MSPREPTSDAFPLDAMMKSLARDCVGASPVRLRRRLSLYSALGIFATGLLVATASLVPFYRTLRANQRQYFLDVAIERSQQIEQFVERTRDLTRQVNSRTRIREALEAYNRGGISAQELRDFSDAKLQEALLYSQDESTNGLEMAAIVRHDRQGRPLVRVGLPVPAEPLPNSPDRRAVPIGNPIEYEGDRYLIVRSPIINPRTGDRVGTDVIWFHTVSLDALLEGSASCSMHNADSHPAMLVDREGSAVEPLLPGSPLSEETAAAFEGAIAQLQRDRAIAPFVFNSPTETLVAISPVANTTWQVLLLQDECAVYQDSPQRSA